MTPDGDPAVWSYALAQTGPLVVAFSGGGDSTSLLAAAVDTARPVVAAIIDHGLRAGSDAAAARAGEVAAALGARVESRRLSGVAPSQSGARAARYAALCAIARRYADRGQTPHLLLAHTRNDQAETVLLRAARGAGPVGLAGMAALAWCGVWPAGRGVALARPFLGLDRAALRADLRRRGASWQDDPANADPRFARTLARAALAAEPAAAERLAATATRLRPLVEAVRQKAQAAARAGLTIDDHGRLSLAQATLAALEPPVRRTLLAALIAAASGAPRAPGGPRLSSLAAALAAPDFTGATLGGALVRRRGAAITLTRDPGAVNGRFGVAPAAPLPLPEGETAVLDGRIAITALAAGLTARLAEGAGGRAGLVNIHDAQGRAASDRAQIAPLANERLVALLTRPSA